MATGVSTGRRSAAIRLVLAVGLGTILVAETATAGFAHYGDSRALDAEVRGIVGELETSLPEGCPILQLPLMEYPEAGPINRLSGYTQMLPYLVSSDLRWSYGGMKGTREGTWGLDHRDDLETLIPEAQAAGFCGVLLDTYSFGGPADLQRYTAQLGNPDLVSTTGRWVFFEWDDEAGAVPALFPGKGYSVAEAEPGDVFWWQVEPIGQVKVEGLSSEATSMKVELGAPPCGPATLTVNGTKVTATSPRGWATVPVRPDPSGTAALEVRAVQPACRVDGDNRTFFARLFDAARTGELGQDQRARTTQ